MLVARVIVAETDPVPVMFTVAGTLHVAADVAPAGAVVTAQERFTTPTNPFVGATVIEDVFPVVAPAATLMAPLLLSWNADSATVTDPVPLDPV